CLKRALSAHTWARCRSLITATWPKRQPAYWVTRRCTGLFYVTPLGNPLFLRLSCHEMRSMPAIADGELLYVGRVQCPVRPLARHRAGRHRARRGGLFALSCLPCLGLRSYRAPALRPVR